MAARAVAGVRVANRGATHRPSRFLKAAKGFSGGGPEQLTAGMALG